MTNSTFWLCSLFGDAVIFALLYAALDGNSSALAAIQFILWPLSVMMIFVLAFGEIKKPRMARPPGFIVWHLTSEAIIVLGLVLIGLPGLAAVYFFAALMNEADRARKVA